MSLDGFFPDNTDRPFDLLTLGDPCVDLYFAADPLPMAGEKRLGRMLGCFAGGTESNVACAASRLGLSVSVCGRVGDDLYVSMLMNEFARFRVNAAHMVQVPGAISASALVMVQSDGEKALVYSPMSEPHALIDPIVDLVPRSRAFYSAPYDAQRFLRHSEVARRAGTRVVIDIEAAMAPDVATFHALLGGAELVFMSDHSLRAITGQAATVASLRALLALGPRLLVVTQGAAGALAVTHDEAFSHSGFAETAVDTTGAGDCFAGAFLANLFTGATLARALAYACAAASFAVTSMGARSGYPRPMDVERRLGIAKTLKQPAAPWTGRALNDMEPS